MGFGSRRSRGILVGHRSSFVGACRGEGERGEVFGACRRKEKGGQEREAFLHISPWTLTPSPF